jgi:D-alanyl-D-alanine-carboxypeptidase/D-alanyl-D-alanine-endopeptidase
MNSLKVDPLPPDATIQRILDERTANKQAFGIVVATRSTKHADRVYAAGASGQPDLALDGDSIFEIGSNTKTFTAALLADMVLKGEVQLDDPLARYLPPKVKVPERGGKRITLVDLATHTSGLPGLPANLQPKDTNNPYADYTVDDMYLFLSGFNLPRDIGSEYEYSNFGYGLLGHALALRAGKRWEQAVTERILQPLEMLDTTVALTPAMTSRLAVGHDAAGQPVPNWDIPALAGMGALRSTANDMLKFLAANMDSPGGCLGPALALTHVSRRQAWSPATAIGLAWQIGHEERPGIIRHSGGTGGYASFIGFDPVMGAGVVVFANSAISVFDIGFHLIDQRFPLDEPPGVEGNA